MTRRNIRTQKGPDTIIGWRATPELKRRFETFLKEQPPIDKTQWLEVSLTDYLDQIDLYGYDPRSLRPNRPATKGRRR